MRRLVMIHPPVRLVGESKKTKETKKDTQNSGKLAIRPCRPSITSSDQNQTLHGA